LLGFENFFGFRGFVRYVARRVTSWRLGFRGGCKSGEKSTRHESARLIFEAGCKTGKCSMGERWTEDCVAGGGKGL
jgi:hypothetical protein